MASSLACLKAAAAGEYLRAAAATNRNLRHQQRQPKSVEQASSQWSAATATAPANATAARPWNS